MLLLFLFWIALLLLIAGGTLISTQLYKLYTTGSMESSRQQIVQLKPMV
jgi:hypothetical protein